MRTQRELVAYLNDYFAPEVWRAAKDLIGNNAVSETHHTVRKSTPGQGITGSRLAFDTPPGFSERRGIVTLALPAQGFHTLETDIIIPGIPDPEVRVELSLQAPLSAVPNTPVPRVHVNLDFLTGFLGFLANFVQVLGIPLFLIEAVLNRVLSDLAKNQLLSKLVDSLGGITSYRFDRAVKLAWDGPKHIVLSDTRPAPASPDPRATGYIDIVLVADGYTAATIGEAREIAATLERTFHAAGVDMSATKEDPFRGEGAPLANAYEAFKTGFRFWLMPLVATDPTDARERITLPVKLPGTNTVNFANLARLAEIGLSARQFFGRDPLLVILSRFSQVDRNSAGLPVEEIRANAQGPFVQLPAPAFAELPDVVKLPKVPWVPKDYNLATLLHRNALAETLQHEFGHTPLGQYLADEYDDQNPHGAKEYFGPEPAAANVSASRDVARLKWSSWIRRQPSPYSPVEGAYGHDTGAFRFQANCKMHKTTLKDFCPVCQEQMLLGLLRHGHLNAQALGAVGMVHLGVTYREPFVATRDFPLSGGAGASAPIFHHGQFTAIVRTRVDLAVLAASVPEPWQVVWEIHSPGSNLIYQTFDVSTGSTGMPLTVDLAPGARVSVSVTHRPDPAVAGLFFPVEVATGALTFDTVIQPTVDDLLPPTDLTQSLPMGGVLAPTLDRATGALIYPVLTLGATTGAIDLFTLPIGIDFSVYTAGPNGAPVVSQRYSDRHQRSPASWVLNRPDPGRPTRLPIGRYRWRARSFWLRLEGGWVEAATDARNVSFEVGLPAFDTTPRPPADPFDLQVLPSLFRAGHFDLVQATSYHPNNRAFRFEFEIKERTVPLNGTGTVRTVLRAWDRSNSATLALTENTPIPPPAPLQIIGYHWRVRASGDDNLDSAWVDGPDFDYIPIPEKPSHPDRWREALSHIDPELLLAKINGPRFTVDESPRGPRILLRMTSQPLAEAGILKELERRGRAKPEHVKPTIRRKR